MKMIGLKKMYLTLHHELPEIHIQERLIERARKPIVRMLEISEKLGL
jgi:quinolinate synthase